MIPNPNDSELLIQRLNEVLVFSSDHRTATKPSGVQRHHDHSHCEVGPRAGSGPEL